LDVETGCILVGGRLGRIVDGQLELYEGCRERAVRESRQREPSERAVRESRQREPSE
jgi:hypothetical protein